MDQRPATSTAGSTCSRDARCSTATWRSPTPAAGTTRSRDGTDWKMDPRADLGRIERQQLFIREAVNGLLHELAVVAVQRRRHDSGRHRLGQDRPPTRPDQGRPGAAPGRATRAAHLRPARLQRHGRRRRRAAPRRRGGQPARLLPRRGPGADAVRDDDRPGPRRRRLRPAPADDLPIGFGRHEGADPRRRGRNTAAADHAHARQAARPGRQQADPVLRHRGDGRGRHHRDRRDRRRHAGRGDGRRSATAAVRGRRSRTSRRTRRSASPTAC